MTREEKMTDLIQMYSYFAQFSNEKSKCHCEALQMAIEALKEQKTGKWLKKNRVYSEESHIEDWQSCCCSVCGHYDTRPYMYYFDEPNYCSYCGARMENES